MKKRTLLVLLLVLVLCVCAIPIKAFAAQNGWKNEDGAWYYYVNDVKATGWRKIGGKWYYLIPENDGRMAQDNLKIAGEWYFFGVDGAMKTGWQVIAEEQNEKFWSYFDPSSGASSKGWKRLGGKWYYFTTYNDSPVFMATEWQEIGTDCWYWFETDGAMRTGWTYDGYEWYYQLPSGKSAIGWQYVSGKWYYLAPPYGAMISNCLREINGARYRFRKSGEMITGWVRDSGGSWYYYDSNGAEAKGWRRISGKWYYFDPTRYDVMVTGYYYIGDKQYYFDNSGAMVTGWVKGYYEDGTYFWTSQLSSGESAQGWQKIGGKWYYFKGQSVDFEMARDETLEIEGVRYTFDASGIWIP